MQKIMYIFAAFLAKCLIFIKSPPYSYNLHRKIIKLSELIKLLTKEGKIKHKQNLIEENVLFEVK